MNKGEMVTRILAIAGTVLAGLPVVFPVVLALVLLIGQHVFLFDYLMPAEFFLLVFAGAALLLWAALRARRFVGPISWTVGTAFGLLVLGQGLALLTGLASGKVAGGWQQVLVTILIAAYALAVLVLALLGIRLCRSLFREPSM